MSQADSYVPFRALTVAAFAVCSIPDILLSESKLSKKSGRNGTHGSLLARKKVTLSSGKMKRHFL